jgi:hypothetical protein
MTLKPNPTGENMTIKKFILLGLTFLATQAFAGGDLLRGRLTYTDAPGQPLVRTLTLEEADGSFPPGTVIEVRVRKIDVDGTMPGELRAASGTRVVLNGLFSKAFGNLPDNDPAYRDLNGGLGAFIVVKLYRD